MSEGPTIGDWTQYEWIPGDASSFPARVRLRNTAWMVYYEPDVVVQRMQAENAKLRKLVVLQSVISKHMSTCPTTDCQACPVNEECAESVHLEGVLGIDDKETSWLVQWRSEDAADVRAENAKLRELAKHLRECTRHNTCAVCEYADDACDFDYDMRELGVEVDG